VIPPLERDRILADDLAQAYALVVEGALVQAAEEVTGPLG